MAPTGNELARLAITIRDECERRGWLQEDLIRESGIGRSTIQRLWSEANTVTPGRRTRRDLERVFGWPPKTLDAILAGADPLPHIDEQPPPPGIDPQEWATWTPEDRELIHLAVLHAQQRAAERARGNAA